MRVLVVGMNPSPRAQGKGSTHHRLAQWQDEIVMDLGRITGQRNDIEFGFTNCTNIVTKAPTPSQVVPGELAKKAEDYDAVVALGLFSSQCLRLAGVEHHVLPHPSPRNRQINDQGLISSKLWSCAQYLEKYA